MQGQLDDVNRWLQRQAPGPLEGQLVQVSAWLRLT